MILYNAKVWTGESENSFVEAIAVRDSLIVASGNSEEILALAGSETQLLDLDGKLVTAGFNDAHIHFLGGSMGLTQVELSGAESFEAAINSTLKFIAENPDKEWITGRGWQYTFFESGLPDHQSMKALDIDRPVFIKAYDGHSAYANPKALEIAGLDEQTEFTGFGEIVKDKNGKLTGALKESAMGLVGKFVPEDTFEDQLNGLRKGLAYAASLGITSAQNASGLENDLRLFQKLYENGELTLRYAAAFSVSEQATASDLDRFIFLKDSVGTANPWLRADAIKFMIDGVIEGHTGAMLAPYADLPATDPLALGQLNFTIEGYQKLVKTLDSNGFRLYTHAIGDRGVREVLNAYEKAMLENNSKGKRHRVEHIETINPDDIPRFAKAGILPSMEPIHAEPGTTTVWSKAVGEERLPYSFAWRSLLDADAQLVFSSDWPACISLNPIRGIHDAVNRRNPSGYPEGGWIPQERISIFEAMKAYTYMGAFSSFEEDRKGLLKAGYLADLIILSDDVFTIDPMKIHQVKVETTIVDGKIIYSKE
ncbi:amidohydrolase [Algoriphagus marinus]|uniref:amidohydrolase n=1 Tax=Algoriphagus marinus TaxID=1925762 RepID=UPI001587FDF5|nr:amidohydrolase [Algoriphagus marinus]